MNITIKSSHVRGPYPALAVLRCLASIATVALCVSTAYSAEEYWMSGSTGARGSWESPWSNLQLKKNDVVILDANKTDNPLFKPFTPWVAIDQEIKYTATLLNGDLSPYMGYTSGDTGLYNEITPYTRLHGLIAKTPSLANMMPSFFTQSDPVYLGTAISQSNDESPNFIKAVTSNPFSVWPISIYSSDALNPETGAPRLDMQNAAWVVLASTGTTPAQRTRLMTYFGDYVPASGALGTRPWDGSYSMINLEHVIFYGGNNTGSGGAINFERSSGLTGNSNSRAIVQVKGDIAVVGNMSGGFGGGLAAQDSIQFDGSVYMVGNIAGVHYSVAEDITKFDTSGGSSFNGEGGAFRANSGGNTMVIFNKEAIFVGNLAAGSGGAISYHNNSTLQFSGKTIFMGNIAGLYMKNGMGREGGAGGAIAFSGATDRGYVDGESYFIGNEASGFGGAIASGNDDADNNGFFQFSANALFTDNISGWNPEVSTIYSNTNVYKDDTGQFSKPRAIATQSIDANGVWSGETIINVFTGTLQGSNSDAKVSGAKIRGGGAIFSDGLYMLFGSGAETTFLRNSTNGMGGAITVSRNSTASPAGRISDMGAVFYDNASFIGNVAAINGGAVALGHYGIKRSDVWMADTGTTRIASMYFGRAGAGSTLLMQGNIAYTAPATVSTGSGASMSGTAFTITYSTGTTVRAANGTAAVDIPVLGGGAVYTSGGGLYVESLYSFKDNQTGGSGGAILIGTGESTKRILETTGGQYGLILNPLDWKARGTYTKTGDFALLQNNVAVRDGGAIASHGGAQLYIGSGAQFLNNYAGGEGGAIALGMSTSQLNGIMDAPQLDLLARVGDIVFKGNRAGVTVDTSTVDLEKILDPLRTTAGGISDEGYMTVDKASGRANDIYVGIGPAPQTHEVAGIINMDAYEDMKIYLDGGISMDHSGTKNLVVNINTAVDTLTVTTTASTITTSTSLGGLSDGYYSSTTSVSGSNTVTTITSVTSGTRKVETITSTLRNLTSVDGSMGKILLSNTTPTGLIEFNNASADIEGVTTIGNGTLRVQGTSNDLHWGSAASVNRDGTKFELAGPATLEANATVNAQTIVIADGAALRVLGNSTGAGTLTLNAGSGGVDLGNGLGLAGNGRMNLGLVTLPSGVIESINVGDIGHTSAQTLTIAKDATTLANVALDNVKLTVGLFGGDASDKIIAGNIAFTGQTDINLSSLASGTFTIASAAGSLTDSSAKAYTYKGTALNSGGRMTFGTSVSAGDLLLNFNLGNLTLDWSGANNGGSLTLNSGNMTNGDINYVLGDVINFGAGAANKTVSVDENAGFGGMNVTDDYTFAGAFGITTEFIPGGAGDGSLTLDAAGKTLTLANAAGAGQRNEFFSVIIRNGTLSAGNAGQLGAALSQITFDNAAGGAALLATGTMILDGAASLHSQQLTVGVGKKATVATSAGGVLNVINNTVSGDGGVFNLEAGAALTLDARGDMAFLGNNAARGGAVALADSARLNVNVASGKNVMFGLQDDRTLRTAANISELDSIYGAASSIIEKNGAGFLSINSNSSKFDGTLNINDGKVALGPGTVFGSSTSTINVNAGAWLGGAAIIGGNVVVDGGYLSVDTGAAFSREGFDRPDSSVAQIMKINGSLDLDSAWLMFNAVVNKSNEHGVDNILTDGPVTMAGMTTVDFTGLWRGRVTLIDSGDQLVSWTDSAPGITSGLVTTLEKIVPVISGTTIVSSTVRFDVSNAYVTSGTVFSNNMVLTGSDFRVTKGGVDLDEERYQTNAGYELIGSILVTGSNDAETGVVVTTTSVYFGEYLTGLSGTLGEGITIISQTNFYDATKLVLGSEIKNMRIFWTGVTGTNWNNIEANWEIPDVSDKTFADGDSLVLGALDPDGDPYVTGTNANRRIDIASKGAWVADMTITGSDNWHFSGGRIATNAGANNYKDDEGYDLSTGQFLIDESFTGTVAFTNGGIRFNGAYVDTGTGVVKLADIDIRNGTLEATALILSGNLINNKGTVILNQTADEDFKDTRLYGTGNIIQTGTGDHKMTLQDTGIIQIANYHLRNGTLQVRNVSSLLVAGTLRVDSGAKLLLDQGLAAGTLVNAGVLSKSPLSSDAQKPPSDQIQLRDPGANTSTLPIMGNYVGDGGTLELNTYRDAVMMNNLFITGAAAGSGKVVIKNITGMDSAATVTGSLFGTGTYYQPTGTPSSVNPKLVPKRDTPVITALGGAHDLKLAMDWENSILPDATVGSVVPFLSYITSTEVVSIESGTVVTGTLGSSDTKTVPLYAKDGTKAYLGTTGSAGLGTLISGTTSAGAVIQTGTYVVTRIKIDYGPSEIDYTEPRDNYKLVQGRDGNWYFRNDSIGIGNADLPFIGAAPIMADMIGQGGVRAFYEHINARHDKLRKGWTTWMNYTHTEDRLRNDYYDSTMIKQDIFQAGADYAFIAKEADDYSTTPSISVGGAYSYTSADATRKLISTMDLGVSTISDTGAETSLLYARNDQSTLKADVHTLTGYASARWWRLYLDMLVQYSPDAKYTSRIDGSVPFDMDGTVKGSRLAGSAELGVVINPPGLGQLEIYGQATGQKHDFGDVSKISEPIDLTNADGYNPIYDPDSPTGRRYHFSSPTTFRAEAGFRWGSHLQINKTLAIRPWGGLAYGRVMSNDYIIYVDQHSIRNDMRGNYYTFRGGASAMFREDWQLYLTLGWIGGRPVNNYTLSSGLSYHW